MGSFADRFARQKLGAQLGAASIAAAGASVAGRAATRDQARINSYTAPTVVLTASDNGADAKIAVAAHSRVYPNGLPAVAIEAGEITGLSFSTAYYVYYDDTTLADTTPTFAATTDQATAQVGAAAGRHYLGKITTPADGGGPASGGGIYPPGGANDGPIP